MKIISWEAIFATIVVFIILLVFPIIFQLDFLDPIQNTFQDFHSTDIVFSQFRNDSKIPVDSNIVLVNIGELSRKDIARQIEIINRYNPKVIGIDCIFKKKLSEDTDSSFENVLLNSKNVVLVEQLTDFNREKNYYDSSMKPIERFSRHCRVGHCNLLLDEQTSTVRTFKPKLSLLNRKIPAFSVLIAKELSPEAAKAFLNREEDYEIINFKRNADKYITLDWDDVLENRSKLALVKNRIVLMGFLGPKINTNVTEDIFFTSMNSKFVGKTYPDMYGLVIHANIVSMILEGTFCYKTPFWLSIFFAFLICYFNMLLFGYIKRKSDELFEPLGLVITFSELILTYVVIIYVFYYFKLELDIAGDFFTILMCATSFEIYDDSLKPLWMKISNKYKLSRIEHKTK